MILNEEEQASYAQLRTDKVFLKLHIHKARALLEAHGKASKSVKEYDVKIQAKSDELVEKFNTWVKQIPQVDHKA